VSAAEATEKKTQSVSQRVRLKEREESMWGERAEQQTYSTQQQKTGKKLQKEREDIH